MPGPSHINVDLDARRRAAFTLVEMLAVMGIIVLLLAATLPALRGLNQSESRRGAIGNMMATLDHARMMAISDGLATYVVFSCPANGSQMNSSLLGRAYAIYEDGDNVSFIPAQKTPWMQLPQGMSFKVAADTTTADCISARFANQAPGTTDVSFPLSTSALPPNTTAGTGVQLPYWKFDGTGAVTEQTYLRLLMFPGIVTPGAAQLAELVTQNTTGASSSNLQKNASLEEIDVNPATGRAKYIIDPYNNLSTPSPTAAPTPTP